MTALAGGSRLCEVSSCFQEARTPETQKTHTHTTCGKLNDQGITLVFTKVKKKNEEKCGIVGWQDMKQYSCQY